ncbi:MAG: Smr/MutS family protein [Bacteroidia bacterium]|nr:Smr/MutS family protein [Bacteroidia bacterium]MDW8158544.1 Smr/MutS family protein [Bacteroidia bacterium]
MKPRFRPGEKVKFLHTTDIGVILQVYPDDRLLVLLDDILELEVPVTEVVKLEPQATDENIPLASNEQFGLDKGIYLAIELGPRLRYYILNFTHYLLGFNFFIKTEQEQYIGKVSGAVEPSAIQLLMTFLKEEWVENSRLLFQFLFFKEKNEKIPPAPEQVPIEIKDRYFQKSPIKIPGIQSECLVIALLLVEKKTTRPPLIAPSVENALAQQPTNILDDYDLPDKVVDLHIEKLVPSTEGLSNILDIQIKAFENALEKAYMHRLQEIVFIHGIGNGVLKQKIHEILRKTEFVKEFFIDASGKYGPGTTVVILKV